MPFETPYRVARPYRVVDDTGSYLETFLTGPATLWGDAIIHGGEVRLSVAAEEDVQVGDLVEVPYSLTLQPVDYGNA